MTNDASIPQSGTGAQRSVAVGLFLLIAIAGIVWGPAGVRALRYRYYEKFETPGGGVISFFAHRGEGKGANVLYMASPGSFEGTAGEPPLVLAVEAMSDEWIFVFPGAEADFREGRPLFSLEDQKGLESWGELIDRRAIHYPELDWERVRDWPSRQSTVLQTDP